MKTRGLVVLVQNVWVELSKQRNASKNGLHSIMFGEAGQVGPMTEEM